MRAFFLLLVLATHTYVLGEDVSINFERDYTKQTRHLEEIDLSEYNGVRIPTDKSIVTLGAKQEIQLFRDSSGVLQIVAPKGVNFEAPAVKNGGKALGSGGGGDLASIVNGLVKKALEDIGISSNVERVTGFVCKPGWKGDRCEQKSDFDVNDFCKKWGGKKLLSSSFKNGKLSGAFDLVRRVAKGTKWHPVNDDLRGTAKYGTPPTDPKSGPTGTAQWSYYNVQYFLFSTGDFSEWMVMERGIIDKKFGSKKQPILCSSSYATPQSYLQLYRNGLNEDPWLSYNDHGTSTMVYGENSYGAHTENLLLDGMNVWIYPPRGAKPPPKKTAFDVNSFCKKWGGKKLTSSAYSYGKYDGYMKLVRRVAKGTKWHPVNDDLRGTAKYGTPPIDPVTGPTGTAQWDYNKVQYFMFSTGDFSEWMVMERGIIDKKFGSKKQPILCSSSYATPQSYLQLYRNGLNEDPWLSYNDHGTSTMVYGENNYGAHTENLLLDGMNVWIYPPQ